MSQAQAETVIIVAAGRGRRMGGETDEVPKCMVKVAGRTILHWQLGALAAAGIDDAVVVRGYRGERIRSERRLRFVENPGWESNNILASLLCAAAAMDRGFYFSYSDIVYSAAVAERLTRATAAAAPEVALVVDRRWETAYQGRSDHPVDEAELALVRQGTHGPEVARVGKREVPRSEAAGEFIGLARFSSTGAAALRDLWERALRAGGLEAPFGRAPTLRQAYLTDAINALADSGLRVAPVFIDGGWREIDTRQDLARAELAVAEWG